MNQITNINVPATSTVSPLNVDGASKAENEFKGFLIESIQQVNSMQQDADRAVEQLMTGGDANPAEVLTAVQKADMTFRMMLQIRNKLVEAYQQIQEIRI